MAMSRDEIYSKVKALLVDTLGVDEEEVTPEAIIKDDLGAESIDFLDISFRLEKAFGIKIGKVSRGKFEARAVEVVEAAQPLLQDLVRGMLAVRRMLWTEYCRRARFRMIPFVY